MPIEQETAPCRRGQGAVFLFAFFYVCPDQVFDIGLLLGLILDVLPDISIGGVKVNCDAFDLLFVLLDRLELSFACQCITSYNIILTRVSRGLVNHKSGNALHTA